MQCRRRDLDPCIYLLVEHLDAALNAGDHLTSLSMAITEPTAHMGPRGLRQREARFVAFVNQVRALEASLIAHILQARRRAAELPRSSGALKLLLNPFTSGTTVLLDAVAEYGDPGAIAFNNGADRLAYLRARGLVAGDSGALMPATRIDITENFLVAARIELGPLLDLVEAFLRALNTEYELWIETADEIEDAYPVLEAPAAKPGISLGDQIASARAAVKSEIDPATGVRRSLIAALSQLEQRR